MMNSPWIPTSLFCVAALAVGVQIGGIHEEVSPKGRVAGLDAHETHAAASLLGQFRTTVSGNLWLRADLYLHNGVRMRPQTEHEVHEGHEGAHSDDGLDDHLHHGDVTTVVPSAATDFRGPLGDLERATAAYKDMSHHEHNSPAQSLPLFRLMTWIDPDFVQAWTTGAHILAMDKDRKSAEQAVAFLEQGLEHNPESVAINNQLGFTHLVKLKDNRRAIIAFQRAIDSGRPVELDRLSPEDQEALVAAYRWLALVYRSMSRNDEMQKTLHEGLRRFPEDVPLQRIASGK